MGVLYSMITPDTESPLVKSARKILEQKEYKRWSREDVVEYLSLLDLFENIHNPINNFTYSLCIKGHFDLFSLTLNGRSLFSLVASKIKEIFLSNKFFKNDEHYKKELKLKKFVFYHKLMLKYKVLNLAWFVIEQKVSKKTIRHFSMGKIHYRVNRFERRNGKKIPVPLAVYDRKEYFNDVENYNNFVLSLVNEKSLEERFVKELLCALERIEKKLKSGKLQKDAYPKEIKVSVVVSDSDVRNEKGLSSNVIKMLSKLQPYGMYHPSIVVGAVRIHWLQCAIIEPVQTNASNAVLSYEICKCNFKYFGECESVKNSSIKNIRELLIRPIVKIVSKWNRNYTYCSTKSRRSSDISPFCQYSANCQHFVDDVLNEINSQESDIQLLSNESNKKKFIDEDKKVLFNAIKKKLRSGMFKNEIVIERTDFLELWKKIKSLYNKNDSDYVNDDINLEMLEQIYKKIKLSYEKRECIFQHAFDTHSELDDFCYLLKESEFSALARQTDVISPIYTMLKAIDRGFWLRYMKETSQKYERIKKEEEKELEQFNLYASFMNVDSVREIKDDTNIQFQKEITIKDDEKLEKKNGKEYNARNKPKIIKGKEKCFFGSPNSGTFLANSMYENDKEQNSLSNFDLLSI